jgi:hypothetical protein
MDFDEKIKKMMLAAGRFEPGIKEVEIRHDDGCPAIKTQNLRDCTCDPDFEVNPALPGWRIEEWLNRKKRLVKKVEK